MNYLIYFITLFSFAMITCAQDTSVSKAKADDIEYIKVCSLNTVEANQHFKRNVEILQAQKQRIIQLQNQLKATNTETDTEAIQTELTTLLEQFNENNSSMVKNYGFSVTRDYTLVIQKSHIYMQVSEEEAEQLNSK